MKQIEWFKRKFDFNFQQNIFPSIIDRLEGTPVRLESKMDQIPANILSQKPEQKWSIKENIGHLIDLEPLWQGRLADILENKRYLRTADLSNTKTDSANHNATELTELLNRFKQLRIETLNVLKVLSEPDIYKSAIHPRLEQPMRTMDLFLFVADHDDHHLARITELSYQLQRI